MRRSLGPDWLVADMPAVAGEYFEHGTVQSLLHCVFIARDADTGAPLGFAEVSLRDYAEGCLSTPVGYLEGWYVEPAARGRGVGSALVRAGEEWARAQGCCEFASDADVDNAASIRAHESLGFEPVAEVRCFRKRLDAPAD
ncbi:MAG: GNAT family N-acetyltransferase [Leptolyngbya sp. PLA3]|nr:MAG: GNAT family N-acetyltransferase [Cyanobacteria bacterium CYA]MCE7968103.1 GNAT family N-acetyltransferase [Leptolyngbya sp. PL-A3]